MNWIRPPMFVVVSMNIIIDHQAESSNTRTEGKKASAPVQVLKCFNVVITVLETNLHSLL